MIYALMLQMRGMCPMCAGGGVFMLLMGILVLAIVVGAAWLIYRAVSRRRGADQTRNP